MELIFDSKKLKGNTIVCEGIINNKRFLVKKFLNKNITGYDVLKGNLTRKELNYVYDRI